MNNDTFKVIVVVLGLLLTLGMFAAYDWTISRRPYTLRQRAVRNFLFQFAAFAILLISFGIAGGVWQFIPLSLACIFPAMMFTGINYLQERRMVKDILNYHELSKDSFVSGDLEQAKAYQLKAMRSLKTIGPIKELDDEGWNMELLSSLFEGNPFTSKN